MNGQYFVRMKSETRNVLIVTHHYLNGVGGGVFASRAYINALSYIYENITLLCPAKETDDVSSFCINNKINIIPVISKETKLKKILNLCIGKINRYHGIFESTISTNKYDLVVFDNSRASSGLITIAHQYVSKIITIHHNYEYDYVKDNMTGFVKYLLLYWTKKYEKIAILESDLNITLTEYDKSRLNLIYNSENKAKIENIGCFEYVKKESERPQPQPQPQPCFLITGNLGAKQTIDSLHQWIDNYYPILRQVCPNYKLIIAGKNPSEKLIYKCQILGVKIIPSPISMSEILQSSKYYICPISKGGGVKLRVMDGLREGLPVVCHEVSTRGYEPMVERGYVIQYEDIKSFEIALKRILTLSYDRDEIISTYNKYYSFESGVRKLRKVLNECL